MITQISYNVLIERFRAFASGHYLIEAFTHGELAQTDLEKEQRFPWMHVFPVEVEPRQGSRLYTFVVTFADLPRDKETDAEYQRESLSDCIKLAEDLLAEIQNGLVLFGPTVELEGSATIEPFIKEFTHTLTGVNLTLTISVPWNWSACDIPADWTVGGSGSGGSGGGVGLLLQTNGVNNGSQSLLNIQQGTNVTITDNGSGTITISASGGGGGGGTVTSVGLQVPNPANPALSVSGSPVTGSGTLAITANGSAAQYIDGTAALKTFPSIPKTISDFLTGTKKGDLISWDGAQWVVINLLSLDELNDVSATAPTNGQTLVYNSSTNQWVATTPASGGTVTSVGLSAPAAFTVSGSPVTTSGTLALSAAGNSGQYIDGSGNLQTFPTIPPAQVNSDWDAVSGVAQILNKPTLAAVATSGDYNDLTNLPTIPSTLDDLSDVNAPAPTNGQVLSYNSTSGDWEAVTPASGGSVTSVALTMPTAFSVSGSPITTAGTLAVTGAGTTSQYVRGDGTLANFPATGGGGGQVFYFNGNVSQGTIGGTAFYELGTEANTGPAANFTRATTGVIARFITDVNSPNHLIIPAGVWTVDAYLSETGGGSNNAEIIAVLKVYNGSTFTTIASSPLEQITNGNVPDLYTFAISVPSTITTATDRVVIEFDIQNTNGKTVTLYTEDGRIGEVHTTYAIGISSLNGLTANTQTFATGTTGTDFGINSAGSVHTFNLPTASASNRGALSSADWTTFNSKQNSIGLTTVGTNLATLPNPSAVRYLRINADNTVSALTIAALKSDLGINSVVLGTNFSNAGTANYEDVTGLSFPVTANKVYKWRATLGYTNTANIQFAIDGPAVTFNRYRFTTAGTTTANAVNNQSAYNLPAGTVAATNGVSTADGLIRPSVSGTVIIRARSASVGGVTVLAGSIVEWEEVL